MNVKCQMLDVKWKMEDGKKSPFFSKGGQIPAQPESGGFKENVLI